VIYLLIGFPVVLVGAGVVFWLQFRKVQAETKAALPAQRSDPANAPDRSQANKPPTIQGRMAAARTAQEFLGFEDIFGNVVKLDANRYRAYIEVEPVSYYLMTGPEQDVLEAGFRSFLEGLRWPTQFFLGSVPLDLSEHLRQVRESAARMPEHLRDYGEELAEFTASWVGQFATLTKRYVLIVSYDYEPNPKKPIPLDIVEQQAVQELENRVSTMIESLGRARLTAHRMDESQIIEFLFQVYHRNPGAALAAKGLNEENLFALYVTAAPKDTSQGPTGDDSNDKEVA